MNPNNVHLEQAMPKLGLASRYGDAQKPPPMFSSPMLLPAMAQTSNIVYRNGLSTQVQFLPPPNLSMSQIEVIQSNQQPRYPSTGDIQRLPISSPVSGVWPNQQTPSVLTNQRVRAAWLSNRGNNNVIWQNKQEPFSVAHSVVAPTSGSAVESYQLSASVPPNPLLMCLPPSGHDQTIRTITGVTNFLSPPGVSTNSSRYLFVPASTAVCSAMLPDITLPPRPPLGFFQQQQTIGVAPPARNQWDSTSAWQPPNGNRPTQLTGQVISSNSIGNLVKNVEFSQSSGRSGFDSSDGKFVHNARNQLMYDGKSPAEYGNQQSQLMTVRQSESSNQQSQLTTVRQSESSNQQSQLISSRQSHISVVSQPYPGDPSQSFNVFSPPHPGDTSQSLKVFSPPHPTPRRRERTDTLPKAPTELFPSRRKELFARPSNDLFPSSFDEKDLFTEDQLADIHTDSSSPPLHEDLFPDSPHSRRRSSNSSSIGSDPVVFAKRRRFEGGSLNVNGNDSSHPSRRPSGSTTPGSTPSVRNSSVTVASAGTPCDAAHFNIFKCDFCRVTADTSTAMDAHLLGSKHLSASEFGARAALGGCTELVFVERVLAVRNCAIRNKSSVVACPECRDVFDDVFTCALHFKYDHILSGQHVNNYTANRYRRAVDQIFLYQYCCQLFF